MTKAERLRRWREKRKKAGICLGCPKPAKPGQVTCGTHPSRAAGLKLWRDMKKAAGICQACSNPVVKGKTLCQKHLKELRQRYYKKDTGHIHRGQCVRCRDGTPSLRGSTFCKRHKEEADREHLKRDAAKREAVKREALDAYGGCFCVCCGEEHIGGLSLEHPNQDGAAHRRRLLGTLHYSNRCGHKFYFKLKQLGFPQDVKMVVLCMFCHLFKTRGDKVCPHETDRLRKKAFAQAVADSIRKGASPFKTKQPGP